jgi:hypothetical protein
MRCQTKGEGASTQVIVVHSAISIIKARELQRRLIYGCDHSLGWSIGALDLGLHWRIFCLLVSLLYQIVLMLLVLLLFTSAYVDISVSHTRR